MNHIKAVMTCMKQTTMHAMIFHKYILQLRNFCYRGVCIDYHLDRYNVFIFAF